MVSGVWGGEGVWAVPLTVALDVQHAVKLIVHGGRSGSCRHQQLDRGGRGGVTRGGQWGMGWREGLWAVPLTIALDVQHAVKLIVHRGRSGSCRHQQLDRGGRGGVTRGG